MDACYTSVNTRRKKVVKTDYVNCMQTLLIKKTKKRMKHRQETEASGIIRNLVGNDLTICIMPQ